MIRGVHVELGKTIYCILPDSSEAGAAESCVIICCYRLWVVRRFTSDSPGVTGSVLKSY